MERGAAGTEASPNEVSCSSVWKYFIAPFICGEELSEVQVMAIDPEKVQGTWEGWGVSLCWWAHLFGDRDDVADWLFTMKDKVEVSGNEVPGLGLTIARYNAGACSWNEIDGKKMHHSKIIKKYRQMEAYWLDGRDPDPSSSCWDWSVDSKQRAALMKAKERGANYFELFSNSPPWWMCSNLNPSGAQKPDVENLPVFQRSNFVHYLTAIARHAKDEWGLAFTSVDPFNEPSASYWYADCKQEGAFFSHRTQAAILQLLRASLDSQDLQDLSIAASDESFYDQAVATLKSFSPETDKLIAKVNVHGYQERQGRRDVLHELAAGRPLWNSEYGDSHGDGLNMARNLHRDFFWMQPMAWCYWQALDDADGWGLISMTFSGDDASITKSNPKLFILAQYTRHIRPKMLILKTDDESILAAYDQQAKRLVLVMVNDKEAFHDFPCDLTAFTGDVVQVRKWISSPYAGLLYERLPDGSKPVEGHITFSVPGQSVLTVEMDGLLDTPPPITSL